MTETPAAYAFHHRAHVRLGIAVTVGVITWLLIPDRFGEALRAVAGWDAAALALGAFGWWLILSSSVDETRARAAGDDPGRHVVGGIVVLASCFSLLATAVVLREARALAPLARDTFVILCVAAVATSWLLTHTAYALRYAHLYYRDDDEGEGGLCFPENECPCYFDFAYFSFTIGMCFQTSDVTISSRTIRREALGQAMLSFVYNTAILATALNLVLGIFG